MRNSPSTTITAPSAREMSPLLHVRVEEASMNTVMPYRMALFVPVAVMSPLMFSVERPPTVPPSHTPDCQVMLEPTVAVRMEPFWARRKFPTSILKAGAFSSMVT